MSAHSELVLAGGAAADFQRGSVFFIGTATVILRYGGFSILTDPNFLHAGDHVHLGYGLTSKRLTEPAIDIEALPALDLCLLSHYHGDHFDRIAEARLDRSLPIVTTRHAARILARKGFRRLYGLDTWESVPVRKGGAHLRVVAMPARHAPGPLRHLLPPVMGSMLEFSAGGEPLLHVYISGDTLFFDALRDIARRYPNVDLALLHLGGTRILGLLMVTMDGRQGVEALRVVKPRTAIPIHYNDYGVFKSPLRDFQRAVEAAGLAERVVYLRHGETHTFEVPAARAEPIADAGRR